MIFFSFLTQLESLSSGIIIPEGRLQRWPQNGLKMIKGPLEKRGAYRKKVLFQPLKGH
jgi:hypothetical protein